ncbi:MAG: hypothetical protein AAGA75_07785 [Cyanobacteria bacterium P01_E01_bin.6]
MKKPGRLLSDRPCHDIFIVKSLAIIKRVLPNPVLPAQRAA